MTRVLSNVENLEGDGLIGKNDYSFLGYGRMQKC